MSVADQMDHLRALVAERAEQVAIGAGEDELAAAIVGILDLIDRAEGIRGHRTLTTAMLRTVILDALA